ncbi:MAG: DNA adenine methylase [Spirochaetales bacterium]|nr:DNA adenine methylase [Spirochaetales bacterium]
MIDFNHPYLKLQIIAYIGNKRRLLPLIYEAVEKLYPEEKNGLSFLDLFSGSGVVSRMAKLDGFQVIANDWEIYSEIINNAYLGINGTDLERMFGTYGGIAAVLEMLNSAPTPPSDEEYIAHYYAPSDPDPARADFKKERLFYTRPNALVIDSIRNRIEHMYPGTQTGIRKQEKDLLVALLLYKAATHTNTSGVFKAYHKGFGGHGRDALSRILKPITLDLPVLIDSGQEMRVFRQDANELVRKDLGRIDICYIDPPYNQHQYGSNYHMLKTIALWDKPPVNNELAKTGFLKEKSAIRKDWTETRSAYCYREKADLAFSDLLENLNTRHILVSYSTEGIIPFERMKELCSRKGRVDLITNEYIKYRGGRQSNSRLNRNIEFIISIDSGTKRKTDDKRIDEIIERKKIQLLLGKYYRKTDLFRQFSCNGNSISTEYLKMQTDNFFTLSEDQQKCQLSLRMLRDLGDRLSRCVCTTREDELNEILIRYANDSNGSSPLLTYVPRILRKLAHRKYRKLFEQFIDRFREIGRKDLHTKLLRQLDELDAIAAKRFTQ